MNVMFSYYGDDMFSVTTMSSEKRKYELRARASRQEETRRRIAAATSELHEEVGPARTTVAEIARRAGVQRLTVYNNFPDERDLFRACQRHWLTRHPPARSGLDSAQRARAGSRAGRAARALRLVPQDRADGVEHPARSRARSSARLAHVGDDGRADGRTRRRTPERARRGGDGRELRAVLALALDFWTWRRLAIEGLDDEAAAALMAETVLQQEHRSLPESSVQRWRPARPR